MLLLARTHDGTSASAATRRGVLAATAPSPRAGGNERMVSGESGAGFKKLVDIHDYQ